MLITNKFPTFLRSSRPKKAQQKIEVNDPETQSTERFTPSSDKPFSVAKLANKKWLGKMAAALTFTIALSACTPPGTSEALHLNQPAPDQPVATQMVEQKTEAPVVQQQVAPAVMEIERPDMLDDLPVRGEGDLQYHFTSAELKTITQTGVTRDQLGPGNVKLTARGVDSYQSSKSYPEGQQLHQYTQIFQECTKMDYQNNCTETRPNVIQYKHLQCNYKNEDTGEMVRVIQRSPAHAGTSQMTKFVCGGHRLVQGDWGPDPVQVNGRGETLYLNPMNIVSMETIAQ